MNDNPYKLDAKQFGNAMGTIAHSQAVMAAVRDYKKEMETTQKMASQPEQQQQYNMNELMNDEELQKLHEERIARLKEEREKRSQLAQKGHGEVTEITEGEFLEVVTQTDNVVCHLFHRDFERCKIMDKHLSILARKYFRTRFIKLSAPDAPFFTVKLNIKMLPCVICFRSGASVERVVGFDGLGGVDDFETSALEERLLQCEVVESQIDTAVEESRPDAPSGKVRKGFANFEKTASDEDSDFDE